MNPNKAPSSARTQLQALRRGVPPPFTEEGEDLVDPGEDPVIAVAVEAQ
jgi:hypothetical protein